MVLEVDNYPGYPNGVDGTKMMEDFKAQAERFDTGVLKLVFWVQFQFL